MSHILLLGKIVSFQIILIFKKSIVFANTHIGKYCELLETTIGERTIVEDDVTLFQKSVVADHCHIGRSTVIKQKRKTMAL